MSKAFFDALRRGFLENVLFAKTAILAHKLRAALTVLGIVIGVSTVIAMVSLIAGFNNSVTASFESFGATLVQFQKFDPQFGPGDGRDPEMRNRKPLTYEDAIALKALCPSMRSVSPERYWFPGNNGSSAPTVNYEGEEANPDTIVGTIYDYLDANSKQTGEGRFINETDVRRSADVIVIGYDIADAIFPFVDPIGKWVQFAGRRYEVIGVMEAQGSTMFESTDAHVYLPITTFDQAFPWVQKEGNGVNIATVPKDPLMTAQIVEEGTNVLRMRRGVPFNKPNDFGIMTPDKLIGNFQAVTGGVALTMLLIASISLLVGGVGVMNIMLVSVTERTKEIGLRKALGAIKQDILTQFLIEAVTLSAVGGVIGVGVGLGIALLVRSFSPLAAAAPLWSIVVGLAVSMSVGLAFGIFPAYRAARLDPIDALRYE